MFGYIKKSKSLKIIKCNKKIQERLNLGLNNYKEYSQLNTPIEIELNIADNKYGLFINYQEKNKMYYHIYFDDSKEEIKRYYLNENEKVKNIKIIIDCQIISFRELFYFCNCINSITFKKFYRNNITDMSDMFSECQTLKEINFSNFNTNNVTNMSYMFTGCKLLEKLNLSNFNTNNVTKMTGMFFGCQSLKELDLSNFNTNNVTDMSQMFSGCESLNELNISNFNTNNATNKSDMFDGCSDDLLEKIKEQNENLIIE